MRYGLADHEETTLPTAVMLGLASDSGQLKPPKRKGPVLHRVAQ